MSEDRRREDRGQRDREHKNGENEDNDWAQRQGTNFIVKAGVKDRMSNVDVSSDFYLKLDKEVEEIIHEAARRARENDRKTVQPRDL